MVRPESIAEKMLRPPMREYIRKHKAVLEKVLIWYARGLPPMVREDTDEHNIRILFDIRDELFKHEENPKKELLNAIFTIVISEYKHDPFYQQRMDWCLGRLRESDWWRLPIGQPSGYWRE